jgi:hypothetical protein
MKEIATALVKAQRAFGPALKSSTNPHFRSKYADLAAVVEAVIDALNNNGIALVQVMHECSDGVIVSTSFIHESGEHIDCGKLHVPASKQDAQGYGSALTYARRYSLMAACGVAPEDDDGNAASKRKTIDITESQMADFMAALDACTTEGELRKAYSEAYAATASRSDLQKQVTAKKDEMKGKIK